jgi:hypothetical protein
MTERTLWTDPALDRQFSRLEKQINGTPVRMALVEEAVKALGGQIQELVRENEELRKEIRGKEWTRPQVLVAVGLLISFLSTLILGFQAVYG